MSIQELLKLDATGVKVADYQDILTDLTNAFKAIYGQDVYLGPDTQDQQWIAALALAVRDTGLLASSVYNDLNPLTAEGDALDRWSSLMGLPRQDLSPSTMNAIAYVDLGAYISARGGLNFNKARFRAPAPYDNLTFSWTGAMPRIDETEKYSMDPTNQNLALFQITLVCEQLGPVDLSVLQPNTRLTTISVDAAPYSPQPINPEHFLYAASGSLLISTINANKSIGVIGPVQRSIGTLKETDVEYKIRQQRSLVALGRSTNDGLQAALLKLAGVLDAKVYENATDTPQPVSLGAKWDQERNSILVVVKPFVYGTASEMQTNSVTKTIALTIATKKSPGCGLSVGVKGSTVNTVDGYPMTYTITIPGSQASTVKFIYAAPSLRTFAITIQKGSAYSPALATAILNAANAYVNASPLGQSVYATDIAYVVRDVIMQSGGGAVVVSVVFDGAKPDRADMQADFYMTPIGSGRIVTI